MGFLTTLYVEWRKQETKLRPQSYSHKIASADVTWMLVRQGLLAVVTTLLVIEVAATACNSPGSLSSSTGVPIWTAMILLLLLAGVGFHMAMAGGTIFTDET